MQSHDGFFIGGKWEAAAGSDRFNVISPSTEEVIGQLPVATTADIDRAVEAANASFVSGEWRRMPLAERVAAMRRLSAAIRRRSAEFVSLMAGEVGIPIEFARTGQVDGIPDLIETYIEIAEQFRFSERRAGSFGPVEVVREPVGVLAAIAPWNGPLFTPVMKLVPALLAGCSAVLKPGTEMGLNAYLLAECFEEAGLPAGVISVVPADREVGAYLVAHPGIDMVSFTGSTPAGRAIAAQCGQDLKRFTGELGGKSAAILLDDGSIEGVIDAVNGSVFSNNGQMCFGVTRVVATEAVYSDFVDAMVSRVQEMKVGDPFDEKTAIGPVITSRQRDRIEELMNTGVAQGARLAVGGRRPDLDKGWFVAPTVFDQVESSMRIAQEEFFGPVLSVIKVRDEYEAIAVANDTPFGLSGAVFSQDVDRATAIAREVRTGTITVNGLRIDWKAPFGGMKASGIGREHGVEVFEDFTELKSISLPS